MIVRIQKGGILEPPVVIEGADSVVVCVDTNVPVVVCRDMEGKAFVVKAGDKAFPAMLAALGYRQDEIPNVIPAGG